MKVLYLAIVGAASAISLSDYNRESIMEDIQSLPKNSDNLDLDDSDEYNASDITNAIKLQIS